MNKNELAKILENPILGQNIYNSVNLRFDDETKFNQQDYSRFIFRNFWYRIKLANEEQAREIYEKIGSDGTFDSFYANFQEKSFFNGYYKKCEEHLKTDTNWANARFLGINDIDGKIYLSLNNEQLYFFADELLKKIIQKGMKDYDFKVNCDTDISRRDGVVIYFNKDNFEDYINIIRAIQREHPEIKFNEPNCFAYRYNDTIGIGKDYKDGSSFTEKCCNIIGMLDLNSPDFSIEEIERSINEHLKEVIALCKKLTENEQGLKE